MSTLRLKREFHRAQIPVPKSEIRNSKSEIPYTRTIP